MGLLFLFIIGCVVCVCVCLGECELETSDPHSAIAYFCYTEIVLCQDTTVIGLLSTLFIPFYFTPNVCV